MLLPRTHDVRRVVGETSGTRETQASTGTEKDPWIHLRVPDCCPACDEQLFTCGCIDVDFTDSRRRSAHDNMTVMQQQDEPTQTKLTTHHHEERTDDVTTPQQEGTTREDVEDKRICVQHQGKLESMTERDLRHMANGPRQDHMSRGDRPIGKQCSNCSRREQDARWWKEERSSENDSDGPGLKRLQCWEIKDQTET